MTLSATKRAAGGMLGFILGTLLALAAPLTYAQTSTTTPGAPETGLGGDAVMTFAVLAISALSLIAGSLYLARTREA